MTLSRDRCKYLATEIALLLGAYVAAFYLVPTHWGRNWPPTAPPTWQNVAYNSFFYPMRWMTSRTMHEWSVSVEKVDPEQRKLLLMISPKLGYVVPYRRRDAAVVEALRHGDRIRARIEYFPNVRSDTIYWEFRDYVRVEGGGE